MIPLLIAALAARGDAREIAAWRASQCPPGIAFWPARLDIHSRWSSNGRFLDLDGDGILDLLNEREHLVRFGSRQGTFAPPVPLQASLPDGHRSVLGVDVNGDGTVDLATAVGRRVAFLLGRGDGSFEAPWYTQEFPALGYLRFSDMNGDGAQDLLFAYDGGALQDQVGIAHGNGDGSFGAARQYPVGRAGDALIGFATPDLENDGFADIVTWWASDLTFIDLLDGAGDVEGSHIFAGSEDVVSWYYDPDVEFADADEDGRLDMILCVAGRTILVETSRGDGTFAHGSAYDVPGAWPTQITTGDFNGDGHVDIATGATYLGSLPTERVVLHGRGDGTFLPADLTTGYDSSFSDTSGDLDGDGVTDFLVSGCDFISVYLGGPSRLVDTPLVSTVGLPYAVLPRNLNADDSLDFLVAAYYHDVRSYGVETLLARGDGTYAAGTRHVLSPSPAHVLFADVNADEVVDALTLYRPSYENGVLTVYLGAADGSFQASDSLVAGTSVVAAGDLDGDGAMDLVALTARVEGAWTAWLSTLRGDGAGGFELAATQPVGGSLSHVSSLTAGLFTHDAIPDIVFTDGSRVVLWRGLGDGTFGLAAVVETPLRFGITGLLAADLDQSGTLDLFAMEEEGGYVLLGNGHGALEVASHLTWEGSIFGNFPLAAAGDVSGDAITDLLVVDGAGTTHVFVGLGNGEFLRDGDVSYGVGSMPSMVALADVNADGALDALVPTTAHAALCLLYGRGVPIVQPPPPAPPARIAAFAAPNPFRTETTLEYAVRAPGAVRLSLFDVSGRLIDTLVNATSEAGTYEVPWHGRLSNGAALPPGLYFLHLSANGEKTTGRVVRIP